MPVFAIIIGIYILTVVSRGNSSALIATIQDNVGFVKWVLALGILYFLSKTRTFGPAVSPLLAVAGVAFALNSLPKLQSQFGQFWQSFRE